MIQVYRVLRRAFARTPLDGEGAFRYGGRWSSPGTRLAYTSEHQSLAMLEYFVHLDADDAPSDLVLVTVAIPSDLSRTSIHPDDLPPDWRRSPAPSRLAHIGDEFTQKGDSVILVVPSALAPHENNWLLNPQHSDFHRIRLSKVEPLTYDPRMFARHRKKRKS